MTMLFDWLISNAITASVLALIAFAVSKAWPRRPALAHACWLLVLVKLLTPPIYVFPLTLPAAQVAEIKPIEPVQIPPSVSLTIPPGNTQDEVAPPDTLQQFSLQDPSTIMDGRLDDALPEATPVVGDVVPSQTVPFQPTAPAFVWSVWLNERWQVWGAYCIMTLQLLALTGSGYLLLLTIGRALRFERLLRLAQPAQNDLQQMTRQLGIDLGLQQSPSVLIVPGKVGPLLWHRWTRPVIVLPAGLLENINEQELQTVLAHELTHYRRGDHLWRYLELAAVACYWWLPSAWWASRLLRQAEEECCDAGVVASLPDGVASYATALVRSLTYVAEPSSPCPALSSGLGPVTLLKRRLTMLQTKVERRLGVRGWLLFAAVAALALPVGISVADDDPPAPPVRREGGRAGERRERNIPPSPPERDDDNPTQPRAAAAPAAPRAPQGTPGVPPAPSRPPVGVAYTTPPAQIAPGPFGSFQGNPEEMRAGLEMAVREAELELKARRIKVRQAESTNKLRENDANRLKKLAASGTVDSSALNDAVAKLENSMAELELAKVDVERAELAVEQAKRRMSMSAQQTWVMPATPPSITTPNSSSPGGSFGMPPPASVPGERAGNRLPPQSTGGGLGGMVGGSFSSGPLTDERLKMMFDNMDKDKNGRVTKERFASPWRERFDEFDTNRDGFVTFDEFKANRERLTPRPGGMATGGFGGGSGGLGGAGGVGGGFGGGGFGVGRGGAGASASLPPADPFFRNFDKQNTGKIRKDDVPEWMRERFFELLDTNRDGVVDHDEFTANYSKLWETPNSRRAPAGTVRAGGRGEGDGRSENGVVRTGPGRGEGVVRGEAGGRGEGAAAGGGAVLRTRPAGDRDPRDNRIEQLEQELREMRKALEGLRGKERSPEGGR